MNLLDTPRRAKCVLLFSGGRDSTLAAVDLARTYELALLTIRGEHLVGFGAVMTRARELCDVIPRSTEWYVAEAARAEKHDALRGCMSCQLTAISAAIQLAKHIGASAVATGFANYQRNWIEQSAEAEVILQRALARDGLRLELPAATLDSKHAAVTALAALSLTTHSLEQKCVTQQLNPALSEEERTAALNEWTLRLSSTAARAPQFEFLGPYHLGELGNTDD